MTNFRARHTVLASLFILATCCPVLRAVEGKAVPDRPPVPTFQDGDKIFFRILNYESTVLGNEKKTEPIFRVYERRGEKYKDYLELPLTNGEFLVCNDKDLAYQIDAIKTKKDNPLRMAFFHVPSILKELEQNMAKNPKDRSKWTITVADDNKRITLTFAGIARVYHLKRVSVPRESPHRGHKQYGNGHAPMFRVYIDRDGVNIGQIEVKDASWEIDFPRTDANIWAVREGLGDTYLIRLRDRNTTVREHPIMERSEIKAEDFAGGTILEKLESYDVGRETRFVFEQAEEVIVENNNKTTRELFWDGVKWYYRIRPFITTM